MREIKLRAWDKLEEKMVNVNRIDFDEKEIDVVVKKTGSIEDYYSCGFYEVELMQYTGLKDKRGTEIKVIIFNRPKKAMHGPGRVVAIAEVG